MDWKQIEDKIKMDEAEEKFEKAVEELEKRKVEFEKLLEYLCKNRR